MRETKWVAAKARKIDGYKLWYLRINRVRNGVGILVEKELADHVLKMDCKSNHIMTINLFVGVEIPNEVSVCAPQIGLVDDIIKQF